MADLPREIISNILSRLPAKYLIRFRCVSKPWESLIRDPNFIQMHIDYATKNRNFNLMLNDNHETLICSLGWESSFTKVSEVAQPGKAKYNSVSVLGSCNGLLYIDTSKFHAIWNPCTKQYKKIPALEDMSSSSAHGFGYDQGTDEYRVVEILRFDEDDDKKSRSEVMVYTMGKKSWRKIKDLDYSVYANHALYLNGTLVWLVKGSWSITPNSIVSFNLGDETLFDVPRPPCVDSITSAAILDGNLCILNDVKGVQADVWVVKDIYSSDSWTKMCSISPYMDSPRFKVIGSFSWLRVLCFCKTGELLLEYDHGDLLTYDPKHEKIEIVPRHPFPRRFKATPYVESLVELNTGTYVGRRQTKLKRKPESISNRKR
ncbi:hypothetical protein ACHQM5_027521 [Ranunculus cassubicifolius]